MRVRCWVNGKPLEEADREILAAILRRLAGE